MASISNFGQTGPYKDYAKADEIEAQAVSGIMYMTGDTGKPPLASGSAICQYSAGLHAYTATLWRCFNAELLARGEYIDSPNNGMRTRTHRINIK